MTYFIELTAEPSEADLVRVAEGLTSFNTADAGPSGRVPLAILVRDEAGAVIGGLSGYTAWGWLYVQWLWVEEDQRGQSLAGQMLERAEAEARNRGCHGAYIDTFNPHALHVYQKAGYTVFGTLPNFPKGRTRSFLSKDL